MLINLIILGLSGCRGGSDTDGADTDDKGIGSDTPDSETRASDMGFATDNEICDDGVDNNGDGNIDCEDSSCSASLACMSGTDEPWLGGIGGSTDTWGGADGMTCAYKGEEPHTCACADAEDNDGDGVADNADLHCFAPFDDDESSFATGLPGDNEGSKGYTECPFDGNSGTGNDDVCCNPEDPSENVVPNGCDHRACCEVDLNKDGRGEFVGIFGACDFAPTCGEEGTHGCRCGNDSDCGEGLFCIGPGSDMTGFCSTCSPCEMDSTCGNPCDCGETCFGGFERPADECGAGNDPDTDEPNSGDTEDDPNGDTSDNPKDTGDSSEDTDDITNTCPSNLTACDATTGCDTTEKCVSGCCYPRCAEGVVPCDVSADCPDTKICVTGCCISGLMV